MSKFFSKYKNFLFVLIPFGFLWSIKPLMPSWFFIPPISCLGGCGSIEGMIPFVGWINTGIKFLKSYHFTLILLIFEYFDPNSVHISKLPPCGLKNKKD